MAKDFAVRHINILGGSSAAQTAWGPSPDKFSSTDVLVRSIWLVNCDVSVYAVRFLFYDVNDATNIAQLDLSTGAGAVKHIWTPQSHTQMAGLVLGPRWDATVQAFSDAFSTADDFGDADFYFNLEVPDVR